MEQQSQQSANTPQIRSRITVVCAECKRLKLKCDRRSPCSSCTKRDTVARCIYSPAAAEKVDLHSLNNRLMQVEATLAQMTAGTFQSTYPPAQPQNAPTSASPLNSSLAPSVANPPSSRNIPFPPNNHLHHHHPTAVSTHVHDSPHPLALSLDELRSAWLDSIESGRPGRSAPGRPTPAIKVELSPVELEQQMRLRSRPNPGTYPHSRHPNPQPYLPSVDVYYSSGTQTSHPSPATYNFSQSPPPYPVATVTLALLDLLPSTQTCMRIFAQGKLVLGQRPIPIPGGWRRFELKALRLLNHRPGSAYPSNGADSGNVGDEESDVEGSPSAGNEKRRSEESLTFFAILCAILAIGASVSPPDSFGAENVNAGFLYALSQQALSVWEVNAPSFGKCKKEKMSFLVACLAGIGYLLLVTPDSSGEFEGREEDQDVIDGKSRAIFPLVGKMVNIAREIGLGKEKAGWQEGEDEGELNAGPEVRKQRQWAWDDTKRMIWWDIMFYDLFTSDALGHPSLISPLSYSAKVPELTDSAFDQGTKKYILARCRLVQLAQRVKHRLSHPDCCCGYTFDQAIALEDEVRRWSRESLSQDDDEKGEGERHIWELSLTAQLLVLRAYVPFLTSTAPGATAKKTANGTSGPSKTSGKIGSNDKPQIQGNAMAMATQSCLGAAQAILRLGNKLHVSMSKDSGNGISTISPALMDFYPLERLVLDAVIITQSSTAVSVVSEAEVRRGLEIMVEREFALGKERREIWEAIKQRVLTSTKLQIPPQDPQAPQLGIKRKHDQVEVLGAMSANEIAETKKTEAPKKQLKGSSGSGSHPTIGVRFREGRMLPSGPARPGESRYDRERESSRSYANTPTLSGGEAGNGGQASSETTKSGGRRRPRVAEVGSDYYALQAMVQQQLAQSQVAQQHLGSFVSSPTTYSPEHQPLRIHSQHRGSLDQSLPQRQHHQPQVPQHRPSFDHSQAKSMYRFEENTDDDYQRAGTTPSSALVDSYVDNISGGQANSSSSSPYQSTTPPFNAAQFGAPDNASGRPSNSQLATDSPTISFGGPDSQSMSNFAVGNSSKYGPDSQQAPPFENPRPTFATENPQPQAFDKLQAQPPTFGLSGQDTGESPTLTGSSSLDHHSHGSSPTTFGVSHSEAAHAASSYFHPAPAGSVEGYDTNAMHSMGVSMDTSVPGTPIYEKPQSHQMMYEKPHQHHLLQHCMTMNGHTHHAMMSNGFVGEPQQAQALGMAGGPQPPHHTTHQSWTSNQPPQTLVGVPTSQSYSGWC